MRPEGPPPDVPFAGEPLRRGPNDAAAILAAKLARWGHVLSSWLPRLCALQRASAVSSCSRVWSIPTWLQQVAFCLARTA